MGSNTVRSMKPSIVVTGITPASVGTTAGGRRPELDTFVHTRCVWSARRLDGLSKQQWWTTRFLIVVIRSCSGMK
jgi:hypothetical protein